MNTPNPLPFIDSLRKEADAFADSLTLTTLFVVIALAIWNVGSWVNFWPAPAANFVEIAKFIVAVYIIFRAVACLIDYTIYAVARAITEFLDALLRDHSDQPSDLASKGSTHQRDSAVAYLHDYLKRPRQALAERAGPAEPPTPAA